MYLKEVPEWVRKESPEKQVECLQSLLIVESGKRRLLQEAMEFVRLESHEPHIQMQARIVLKAVGEEQGKE